jgi:hypothetical protein
MRSPRWVIAIPGSNHSARGAPVDVQAGILQLGHDFENSGHDHDAHHRPLPRTARRRGALRSHDHHDVRQVATTTCDITKAGVWGFGLGFSQA